jgi:hypothetical protein
VGAQPGLLSKRSEEEYRTGRLCTPHSGELLFQNRVTVKENRIGVQDRMSLYSSFRGVAVSKQGYSQREAKRSIG